ncbi:sensor histidine kinase [uncultured Eubacterium sp.]|uniref:sensor histidine kinase n=1 Tax=uncultured Eubacterium sp. TaxID=165185 RepID=UPI00267189C9|nr:GHKL domain-containing protein [uncultured Eubacterium sp.]
MFDNLIILMTNAFEIYIIYKFLGTVWGKVCVKRRNAVILYGLGYFLTSIVMLFVSYPIINLLSCFILFLLITMCYNATVSKKIIVSILCYIFLFLSEAVVAFIVGLSNYSVTEKAVDNIDVAIPVMNVIVFGVLLLVVERFINLSSDIKIPKLFTVAIVLVLLTSVILLTMVFRQKNVNYVFSMISLSCVLISNFIIVYLYDSITRLFDERTKSELIKRERTYYHNQSELLQKNYGDLRKFRHDLNNKIIVIKQLLEKNRIEELNEYISDLSGKIGKTDTYCQSGNVAVDSIVNYKLSFAHEKGIDIRTDISIPPDIIIENDDIVIIIGNLLDNAIEAAVKTSEKGYICFQLKLNKNSIYINVENSHSNNFNKEKGKLTTTKEDKKMHGIGLKSVESVVEKYEGVMDVSYNDVKFDVTIIIYNN